MIKYNKGREVMEKKRTNSICILGFVLAFCTSQEKVDNLCKKEGDWFDKLILFIIIIIFKLNRSKIF